MSQVFVFRVMCMNPRQPRVYRVRRSKGEKDLLVFDAGCERGKWLAANFKLNTITK